MISQLLQVLSRTAKSGAIDLNDCPSILHELQLLWPAIKGSLATSMSAHKLRRIEDVRWTPPILSFTLERHGAAANGSTRAELQRWEVNLDTLTAEARQIGRRQIAQTAPRIKLDPIVEEVFDLISSGADDDGLKWYDNKSRVRIVIGNFIPNDGFQMTISSRRRRFLEKLTPLLASNGWMPVTGSTRWFFSKATAAKASNST